MSSHIQLRLHMLLFVGYFRLAFTPRYIGCPLNRCSLLLRFYYAYGAIVIAIIIIIRHFFLSYWLNHPCRVSAVLP